VTEQEIETKVIDIVADQMGVDKSQITRETAFTDLNADSLDTSRTTRPRRSRTSVRPSTSSRPT